MGDWSVFTGFVGFETAVMMHSFLCVSFTIFMIMIGSEPSEKYRDCMATLTALYSGQIESSQVFNYMINMAVNDPGEKERYLLDTTAQAYYEYCGVIERG